MSTPAQPTPPPTSAMPTPPPRLVRVLLLDGWAAVTGRGWALDTGDGRLIGVGWFQDSTPWNRQAGHNLMVWPTRREARAALRDRLGLRGCFPRARVVPVSVTVAPRRAA